MAAKTMKQILGTHAEIVAQFKEHKEKAEARRPAKSDFVVRQKQNLLTRLETRLEGAKRTRDEELKRHDAEIQRLEDRIAQLQSEIETDKKNIGRAGKPVRKKPVKPRRGARPKSGSTVARIKGVGKVLRTRLEKAKIRTAADVAAMTPAQLAEVLSVPESRAKRLVSEAKKVK